MARKLDIDTFTFPSGEKVTDVTSDRFDDFMRSFEGDLNAEERYATENEYRLLKERVSRLKEKIETTMKPIQERTKAFLTTEELREVQEQMMFVEDYMQFIAANHWNQEQNRFDVATENHPEGYDNWNVSAEKKLDEEIEDRGSQRLNFVLEKLAAAGIEVVQDKEEYQWMKEQIDEINITLEMLEEKPLAIQYKEKEIGNLSTSNNDTLTRSQSLNAKSILDSSNSQEVIKNLVSLGNSKNKIDAEEFLSKLKEAFQLDKNKASTYVHNKNGNIELRLSNHCANASDSKRYDKSTSIVIKLARGKNAPKFRKSPESDLIEFAYYPENLTLESEKAIVNGLIDWVKTGEYTYTQADEVHQSTRKDFIKKHKHNQKMTYAQNEQIYGFTYEGKIYLNPEIANSEVALHEYTHLWDNYTQRTNPELWEKGKDILKDTKFWNEVKNDPNYADIVDSDDLLLSEVHAQICGKMAESVLSRIQEQDGELTKDTVIDWDKEVSEFIAKEFQINPELGDENYISEMIRAENLKDFLSMPMKDFMNGVHITQNVEEKSIDENISLSDEIDGRTLSDPWNRSFVAPDYWTNEDIEHWKALAKEKDVEIVSSLEIPYHAARILNGEETLDTINNLEGLSLPGRIETVDQLIELEKKDRDYAWKFSRLTEEERAEFVAGDKGIDEFIEQIQSNGGMSEAAMEAEIVAEENPRPDFIDEQGNPHWFDEEEDYEDGKIPLEVVDRSEILYFNSDEVSAREYKIRIDEGLFSQLVPERYSKTAFEEGEIPAITYRQSTTPDVPNQFLISKFKQGNYDYPLIQTTIDIKDEELLKQIKINVENYEAEWQQSEAELLPYYERFEKEAATESEEVQLQKALAYSLDKNVSPLTEVKLNRENWNKLFPNGIVETPVATVKLGENQFEKLLRSDRNNLLASMYETLSNPAIVLEKETLDEKSGEFRPVNVYGKSFIREDSNHKRVVESVIIFKDGENISIGTHNKNIKDFVKQIKTADQIIYTDSEISRVASLILQNGGSHVRLHDAISNRVINQQYDKNNLLSIKDLEFSNADEIVKKEPNSSLEQKALNNAANLLKNMQFTPENYKKLLNVINEISDMNGLKNLAVPKEEEIASKMSEQNNEKHETFKDAVDSFSETKAGETLKTLAEQTAGLPEGSIETAQAVQDKIYEAVHGEPKKEEIKPEIVFGETTLPTFSVLVGDKMQPIENAVVTGHDKNSGSYFVESNGEKFELPKATFDTLFNDKVEKERQKARIAEGKTIVFEDKERGVKGTEIPEWSMYTSRGLETFKGFVPVKFNKAEDSYTLSNGDQTLTVTAEKFREITAPERFENKFDEDSPAWKKLCETQYKDFFEPRDSTAYNFRHNLSVYCRREATSPCDALRIAKGLIEKMPKDEQKKTQRLLKAMAHENESTTELIARLYHEAIKEQPLNEDYMKVWQPRNVVARPFYDTISSDGQKVDNDPALVRGSEDRNLKIGMSLKNVDIETGKLFGRGKDTMHFDELKVISSSKEGNSVTLMDGNKSIFKLPRDTVLKFYKEQQLREMKHEHRQNRSNTMTLGYA